jgi:hypothetical protein
MERAKMRFSMQLLNPEGIFMGRRIRKAVYWQDAPTVREQIVLIPTTLDDRIPEDHPVRPVDSLLSKHDSCKCK